MKTARKPFAKSVAQWGRDILDCSPATAYRIVNGEDPPPTIILNNVVKVATGSPEYQEWLDPRMSIIRHV